MFVMECLDAKEGDCIILHFGDPGDPRFILVDSGPRGTYSQRLKPRLDELKEEFSPDDPLMFELGMVSHIDGDHITGFLDHYERAQDGQEGEFTEIEFRSFWHNSLRHLHGDSGTAAIPAGLAGGAITASNGIEIAEAVKAIPGADHRAESIIASFGQGDRLQSFLVAHGIADNQPHGGAVRSGLPPFVSGPLEIEVVGPNETRLGDLRDDWPTTASMVETAAYLDGSVANLSSITAILSCDGKTIFLTGDARGDDLLCDLKSAGKLADGGTIRFDILKMPHHGSDRNMETGFLRTVLADTYVFSANGRHHNPDAGTIAMLREARRGATFRVVFTNPLTEIKSRLGSHADHFQEEIDLLRAECNVLLIERDANKNSVMIELA